MKRKVATMGRCCGEFSWSMSVEPGERCLPKHRRESVGEPCGLMFENPGFCSGRFREEPCRTNSVFFRDSKETHGTVL